MHLALAWGRLASSSSSAPRALHTIATAFGLDSKPFANMRGRGDVYVDKTDAIADLLMSDDGMHRRNYAFFARPRKFGKSLTLDVAAEMLAAGALPRGATAWPGYVPVDVDAMFGGLAVHERLRRGDASLRGLLQRAHFVVKLGLGGAMSGAKLEVAIFDELAGIAGAAFGAALKVEVRQQGTPMGALRALVSAVPRGVPVALLVDEYDAAIIQDVSKGRWAAASAGIDALRSLAMATKAPDLGARLERCIFTGAARFAQTSLFSGANNFADITEDPVLSRAVGFSEREIRTVFDADLQRLASGLGSSIDGAIEQLAHWYNGYCFDGVTSSYNPFAVLKALQAGAISTREMEAASGTNWLGLAPASVIEGLVLELQRGVRASVASVDVADLEAQRVRVVPLLLQTGLLSAVQGQPLQCRPPNEYARQSLQRMVETALAVEPAALAPFAAALHARDRGAFIAATRGLFERIPRSLLKKSAGGDKRVLRESTYHAALFSALMASAPLGVVVTPQAPTHRGLADIVVCFPGVQPQVWILELGVGGRAGDVGAKLVQAQAYSGAYPPAEHEAYCCAIIVADVAAASSAPAGSSPSVGELVQHRWARRSQAGAWEHVQ